MEISINNIALGAAALAAAVAAFIYLHPSEERRIKAAFEHAAETISKEEGESLISIAAKNRSIADLADREIAICIPEQRVDAKLARSEMAQQVTIVRKSCSSLTVAFESVAVQSIDGDTARATADLLVSGSGTMSFLNGRDTREVEAVLRKSPDDGKWRFSSVSIKAIVTP